MKTKFLDLFVCPSVLFVTLYQRTDRLSEFIKYRIRVLCQICCTMYELCDGWLCDSHTLLRGV
jgi:hypothetical protein